LPDSLEILRSVGKYDASLGREGMMVSLDLHNVILLGRGPVGAEEAVLAVMDRVFFT
jgi:hypothetical protein